MILKRESEFKTLQEDFIKPISSFLFIFGRKQVGKTTFLQEYTKDKSTLFFSCIEVLPHILFEFFQKQIIQKEEQPTVKIETFSDFLLWLSQLTFTKKTVIIFDDFHTLYKIQKGCLGEFFKEWNSHLKQKNIQIIFSSSIITHTKEEATVFQNASEKIVLEAFGFETIKTILPESSKEEQLKLFALFGTHFNYFKNYSVSKSFEENLNDILREHQDAIIQQGWYLLKSELGETATYASILYAIANGNNKIGEIAQTLGVKSSYLTRYLQKLNEMMFIKKRVPMNEDFAYSKFGRYSIEDNFLRFWFKCIYINLAKYEQNSIHKFTHRVLKTLYTELLPQTFQTHMYEMILRNFETFFGYKPIQIGSWWNNKDQLIDMVAFNDSMITFIEIQYQTTKNSKQIYEELKKKSEAFQTVLHKQFALFSSH